MDKTERNQRAGADLSARLADIRAKTAERDRLLAELAVWVELLKNDGIPADAVDTFGYDPAADKRRPVIETGKFAGRPAPRPLNGLNQWRAERPVYNFVRLKTGETVPITPIPVPSHCRGELFT